MHWWIYSCTGRAPSGVDPYGADPHAVHDREPDVDRLHPRAVTIKEIENYDAKMGYHHQATSIVQGTPDTHTLFFILQQVWAQQHPNGATYTEQYSDMRSYGSGGAVQQRADNTRLSNASILHNHATAATSSSEEDALDWAIHDSLMEQKRLYDSAAVMMPPDAPMKSTAALTCSIQHSQG